MHNRRKKLQIPSCGCVRRIVLIIRFFIFSSKRGEKGLTLNGQITRRGEKKRKWKEKKKVITKKESWEARNTLAFARKIGRKK